jgi:hypothetical protein
MKRVHLFLPLVAALAGASILGMPLQAQADDLLVRFTFAPSGPDIATYNTNGLGMVTTGGTQSYNNGGIIFTYSATATGVGTPTSPAMELMVNITAASNSNPFSLFVRAYQDASFYGPIPSPNGVSIPFTVSGTPSTGVTGSNTVDLGTQNNGPGDATGGSATLASLNNTGTIPTLTNNPNVDGMMYALTDQLTISFSHGGQSYNGTAYLGTDVPAPAPTPTGAPEPATLTLLGLGALGMLGYRFGKRRLAVA